MPFPKLFSRPCQEGHPCGAGGNCPCPLRDIYRAVDKGSHPASKTEDVQVLPALPLPAFRQESPRLQLCQCGAVFTEGLPIWCGMCRTFTHTVYWLRRPHAGSSE